MAAVFDDARLMDAAVVLRGLDSFFAALGGGGAGGGGGGQIGGDGHRMHGCWTQLMDRMESYPGVVILLADQPKDTGDIQIHEEILRNLQFVTRFKSPGADVRKKFWERMLPRGAPRAADIEFSDLARQYSFTAGTIRNAVFRAAAAAALRPQPKRVITMKDLKEAAKEENKKNGSDGGGMGGLFM